MLTNLIPVLTRLHTIPQTRFTRIPAQYRLPPFADELTAIMADSPCQPTSPTFDDLIQVVHHRLDLTPNIHHRAALETTASNWLYDVMRRNIRRGRAFELQRVLTERRADCLGYARFFDLMGRSLGLNTGIVEVIVDNAGRNVPHFVNLVRLSDGTTRFVDAWYGSNNIIHRRLGLQVNMNGDWVMLDVDYEQIASFRNTKGIPQRCVYATAVFMIGNRHLRKGLLYNNDAELDKALENYDTALTLYPENARFHFNRAVLLDQKGITDKANREYSVALSNDGALIRLLAREHEEVTNLVALDENGISPGEQDLYLLHKGFITGSPVPIEEVARQKSMPAEHVRKVLEGVESTITPS